MVISQQAVKEFRARRLRDLGALKLLPRKELDRQLKARGAVFVTPPRDYQKVAVLAGLKLSSLYLMLDPGLGKSKVTLDLFRSRRARGEASRLLVLVPGLTNVEGWREQVAEHAPDLRFAGLDGGTRVQKQEALEDRGADVVCVTYQGWLSLTCVRVEKGKGKRKRMGFKLDVREHDRVASGFDMVAWDECTFIKNHMSVSFSSARRMHRVIPLRLCLSGTPFDKDPVDLWAQFYILDAGETLGDTLGIYRGAYFNEKEDYWRGTVYTFDQRNKSELRKVLRNRAVRYKDHECLDLPPLSGGMLSNSYMARYVRWPDEAWTYYQELMNDLVAARNDPDFVENTYIRMRQVCSGFLPVDDPDTGERHVVFFKENPLLDALVGLLGELPPDRKVLVFNEYKESGQLICARLKKEKVPHVRIFSGTPDKKAAMRQFKQDMSTRVLVGSRAVCFGLNLQVANYAVIYESPDSAIVREQLERRIYRQGQERHTYIWDLVVRNSVGPQILKAVRAGKNLSEELMRSEDPRSWLT